MSAILCEGIDEDMAMLKIFKRYFKLKAEMNEIETIVKQFGFKSVEECLVLLVIVESQDSLTRAKIQEQTQLANSTISVVTTNLDSRRLLKQANDKTDTSRNVLRRQIYTPTKAGIDLIEKLKQQLQ